MNLRRRLVAATHDLLAFLTLRVSYARQLGMANCPGRVRVLLLILLLLLGAWYLTPEALQGAGCPQNTTALCHDAGERGTMAHGRDHIVCIYPDRVTKIVRSCSAGSGGAA